MDTVGEFPAAVDGLGTGQAGPPWEEEISLPYGMAQSAASDHLGEFTRNLHRNPPMGLARLRQSHYKCNRTVSPASRPMSWAE
jgi:hypothetical protein